MPCLQINSGTRRALRGESPSTLQPFCITCLLHLKERRLWGGIKTLSPSTTSPICTHNYPTKQGGQVDSLLATCRGGRCSSLPFVDSAGMCIGIRALKKLVGGHPTPHWTSALSSRVAKWHSWSNRKSMHRTLTKSKVLLWRYINTIFSPASSVLAIEKFRVIKGWDFAESTYLLFSLSLSFLYGPHLVTELCYRKPFNTKKTHMFSKEHGKIYKTFNTLSLR